jgi:hypothetical protein
VTSLRHQVDGALEIDDLHDALRRVEQAATAPAVVSAPMVDPLDAAQAAVLDGGDVPDTLGDEMFATQQAQQASARQAAACHELMRRLHRERTDRRRSNADRGLAVLADALAEILTEGPGVLAEIADVDDAETAIRDGKAEAWRRAKELADQLAELRALQLDLVADTLEPPAPPSMSARPLPSQPSQSTIRTVRTYGAVRDYAEWWDGERYLPWEADDRLEALRWTCSDDADAWLPSTAELRAAIDDARQQREQERLVRLPEHVVTSRFDRDVDRAKRAS